MIIVSDLSMTFDKQTLFKHVDLKFTPGNCYGIIGANGAGKSTFLRILEGQLEPSTGTISMAKNMRMSVLRQDHFAFDEYSVLDTVIMGNKRLYSPFSLASATSPLRMPRPASIVALNLSSSRVITLRT